jgi:hypothetical protein
MAVQAPSAITFSQGKFLTFITRDGTSVYIQAGEPNFAAVEAAYLALDWETMFTSLDLQGEISAFLGGDDRFAVSGSQILFKGRVIPDAAAQRIAQIYGARPDKLDAILRFIERLFKNPDQSSRTQLMTFLEHRSLPIGPNGTFYAYKAVTADYLDFHTKSFDNRVGKKNKMPRSSTNSDPKMACGSGFHMGSHEFANNFSNAGHLMITECDPEFAVSVPLDSGCEKLRMCKYKVVAEGALKLPTPFWDPDEIPLVDAAGHVLTSGALYQPVVTNEKGWEMVPHTWDPKKGFVSESGQVVPFLGTLGRSFAPVSAAA